MSRDTLGSIPSDPTTATLSEYRLADEHALASGAVSFPEHIMTDIATAPLPALTFCAAHRAALRVKIKSLADEARIIRNEERRARNRMTAAAGRPETVAAMASAYTSLRAHRVNDVRRESRYSLLAYAMLRGKPMASCEPARKDGKRADIDLEKLSKLVSRFCSFGGQRGALDALVRAWLAP